MATFLGNLSKSKLYVRLVAGLFVLFVAAFALYIGAEKQLDSANKQRALSFVLADELRQSSDDLTRMVRSYVVTGDARYKHNYLEILRIRDGKHPRPIDYDKVYWDLVLADNARPRPSGSPTPLLELMSQAGFTPDEFAKLEEAKRASDALTQTEFAAMALVESSLPYPEANRIKAISMLHDATYHQAKSGIMRPILEFSALVDKRTLDAVETARNNASGMRLLFVLLGISLVLLLWRMLNAINQEVNEKTESEVRYSAMSRLFNSIVENIPNMIFLKRASDLRFAIFNKAGEQLLGFDRQDLLGKNDYDFFPSDQADSFTAKDREVLQSTAVLDIPEEAVIHSDLNNGA